MMQNPKSDTNLFTRQNRLTDFENELTVTGTGGGGGGRTERFDMYILYLK